MLKRGAHRVDHLSVDHHGETHDDFETRFWMSTVTAGAWVTLLMCLAAGVYAAFFASDAHRVGVTVMVGVAAVGGAIALWGVPWRRVIASPWREHAFFCWTLSTISVVTATVAFDGGAQSPLALMKQRPWSLWRPMGAS